MAACSIATRREESHVAKCLISDIDLSVSLDTTSNDMGVGDITQEMIDLLAKVVQHLKAGDSLDGYYIFFSVREAQSRVAYSVQWLRHISVC